MTSFVILVEKISRHFIYIQAAQCQTLLILTDFFYKNQNYTLKQNIVNLIEIE